MDPTRALPRTTAARRLGLLLALALPIPLLPATAGAASSGPVPGTAARAVAEPAVPPGEEAVVFAGTTGPAPVSRFALQRATVDGSRTELLLPPTDEIGTRVTAATVSPLGDRVAYTAWESEVPRVRRLDGRGTLRTFRSSRLVGWMPDGQDLLIAPVTPGLRPTPLTVVPAAGGAPRELPGTEDLHRPVADPSDPRRLVGGYGDLLALAPDGTRTPVGGDLGKLASDPVFSRDGGALAWTRRSSLDVPPEEDDQLVVARGDGSGARVLPLGGKVAQPAWSLDGSAVYVLRTDQPRPDLGTVADLDFRVWRVPLDGSAPTPVTAEGMRVARSELSVVRWPAGSDVPQPQVAPARLTSTSVTLTWAAPAPGSRVEVRRAKGVLPPLTAGTLRPTTTATSLVERGLRAGQPWTWTLTTVAADGRRSDPLRVHATPYGPPLLEGVRIASSYDDQPYLYVAPSGTPAADVEVARLAADGTRGAWQSGTGLERLPQSPAPRPGDAFALRVRGYDDVGGVTAWRLATPSVVPLYDRSAAYGPGWSRQQLRGRWLGTLTTTKQAGRTVTLRFRGTRVSVVGDKCPACGRLAAYLDGKRVGTVDMGAGRLAARQVLWTRAGLTRGKHVLRLVTLATPRRPKTSIDGYAVLP